MPHEINLTTLAAALGMAVVLGVLAARLKLPALLGYLVACIVIGQATPGFVADSAVAAQLAEIGMMLLMFGVVGQLAARGRTRFSTRTPRRD